MRKLSMWPDFLKLEAQWKARRVVAVASTRDPEHITQAWLDSLGDLTQFQFAGTVLRTSGTSSQPKSVLHTLDAHVANAKAVIDHADLRPGDKWLLSLPIYHVGGLSVLVRCMLAGATVAHSIDEPDVTHTSLVATQLYRMMRDPVDLEKLKRLKRIYVGGGPISQSLLEAARTENLAVVTTYGSTEMASQIATDDGILPDREVKMSHDGEICVRGPMLMMGYLRDGIVNPSRDDDGWFHTGDMGRLRDGKLEIWGRRDNMMISGGENIHPEEIEQVLLSYPHVENVVVVARSDPEYGERPIAYVQMRDLRPDLLAGHARAHLAGFKVPVEFLLWPNDVPVESVKLPRAWFKEMAPNRRSDD